MEAELRLAEGKTAEGAALLQALLKRNPDSAYLARRLKALE